MSDNLHNNPDSWLRFDMLPVFGELPLLGEPLTTEVYNRALSGFEVYKLRCTCTMHRDDPPDVVDILHISPDKCSAGAKHTRAAEVARITKFMKADGFTIEQIKGPRGWCYTDVLILGTDKSHTHRMNGIIEVFVQGAGVMYDWNVLLYGMDGMPAFHPGPNEWPLLTDQNFGSDCICMLHSHIRMRDRKHFWVGHIAYMSDVIEHWITVLIMASPYEKSVDSTNLKGKIDILSEEFRRAKMKDMDVELFTCAAHLVRVARNEYVHFMANKTKQADTDKVYPFLKKFTKMVETYGRRDLLLGLSVSNDLSLVDPFTSFLVRLTNVVCNWLFGVAQLMKK